MAKLYFLGGENVSKRNSREVNEAAFHDAGEKPSILVLPWARPLFDRARKRRKRLLNYFTSIGAGKISFSSYSDASKEIADKVGRSDLIYLLGGFTTRLIKCLKERHVDRLLREYGGVIIGRSAGALALCGKCILTDRNKSEAKIISGLGIADFTMKVHYKSSKDDELKMLSKEDKIYALPERSALVYENGDLRAIGKVYLFQDGKKELFNSSNASAVKNSS